MDKNKETFLMEAVASSKMEGLSFTLEEIKIAEKILDGSMTLNDYLENFFRSSIDFGARR